MLATSSTSSLGSSPCFLGLKLLSNNTSSSLLAPSSVRFQSSRVTATYASTERTRSSHLYSSNMASPASHYEVLAIPTDSTSQDIKAAYRRLARVCHPDAVAMDRKGTSANEFMKIHAAYSTLSDPQKRADYDHDLFGRHRIYTSPSYTSAYASSQASSGYTRRNWETDQCCSMFVYLRFALLYKICASSTLFFILSSQIYVIVTDLSSNFSDLSYSVTDLSYSVTDLSYSVTDLSCFVGNICVQDLDS
ncbi:hypothetical protein NE237_022116 [Protea cynaroides]|uniref:J domain-containing protein n=1 Tax=Protea cynaroides TaxID=273540 RepID=A0A9Q0K459_9MAGN|nr:hypothetical protein NE237_022116 [Protea cynaroides]